MSQWLEAEAQEIQIGNKCKLLTARVVNCWNTVPAVAKKYEEVDQTAIM